MKATIALAISATMLWACGTTATIQPSGVNTSTTAMPSVKQGIGPVNMALSNFYYSGEVSMKDFNPYFFSCASGQTLPIAREAAFQSLINRYANLNPTETQPMFATLRGYTRMGENGPELVVTYITSLSIDERCEMSANVTGTYVGFIPNAANPMYQIGITLNASGQLIAVVFVGNTNHVQERIVGTWNLISNSTISLSYLTPSTYIAHTVTIGSEPNTLIMNSAQWSNLVLTRKVEPTEF